ncbi:H-2 class II histocompatibility antigen, I-E beta chain-like [Notechis scutatus]|uniref:H-2 class II histocompatibility antigen, I-E beta chain-like n=1 Tax=Notechis scutatus TaxID=8663 RepID=A0A6J1W1H6_9SAUR|nr:H-2 class II histocompatibility antigen, I-E beta chain-like [Notechis scutatus]
MGPGVPPDALLLLIAAHFLVQWKSECLFLNGTQRVQYLFKEMYDRQEFVRFDSDFGKFVAVTAFGKADADIWNSNEQIMQYQKAAVDFFCRHNYEVNSYKAPKREERAIGRRSEAFGEELQNGDWTYQLQVMLETQPQWGDVYTCQVGHVSLEAPITVQWEPRSSSSARSKLWTGIMGAVIGAAFLAVGLFSYLKSKKATPIQTPAALMD